MLMKRKDERKNLVLGALAILQDGEWHEGKEFVKGLHSYVSANSAIMRHKHWYRKAREKDPLSTRIAIGRRVVVLSLLQSLGRRPVPLTEIGVGFGLTRKHRINKEGKSYYAEVCQKGKENKREKPNKNGSQKSSLGSRSLS